MPGRQGIHVIRKGSGARDVCDIHTGVQCEGLELD